MESAELGHQLQCSLWHGMESVSYSIANRSNTNLPSKFDYFHWMEYVLSPFGIAFRDLLDLRAAMPI
jgi:uncharacterized membrane protein